LIAFNKKDGVLRPIAVGMTLRRLVGKVASVKAIEVCRAFLSPRQLGIGAKGGAEAIAHAARRYIDQLAPGHILVKIDFSYAFNSVWRDVLESVVQHIPELLPLVTSAYGSTSFLMLADKLIEPAEGVQQGDPLSPLLFSLAIH
jgi:hypothetical protein